VFRQDYLPFGETILTSTGDPRLSATGGGTCGTNGYLAAVSPTRVQFTEQIFDTETGFDYFGARYFAAGAGRFMSADAPFNDQDPGSPQSWNMYSYVRNSPLRFYDPTGRCSVKVDGGPATDDDGAPCVSRADSSLTVSENADGSTDYINGGGVRTGFLPNTNDGVRSTDYQLLAGLAVARAGLGAVGALFGRFGTRVAPLAPLIPPAGGKLGQIMARLGPPYNYNRDSAMAALTSLRDAAAAAGNKVSGFYIEAGSTIYRLGDNYLTVSSTGKVLSYVQNARPGEGVVARYVELGGK
jgi:RHS repeat-associated protein